MHLNLKFEQFEIYLRQASLSETQGILENLKTPELNRQQALSSANYLEFSNEDITPFNRTPQGEKFEPQTYQDLSLSTIFEMSEVQNKEYHLWVTLY